MPEQDPKPTIHDLLSSVDDSVDVTAEEVPDFIARARQQAAAQGIKAIDLLEKDALDALRNAVYPSPACIQPYELELAGDATPLALDRLAHLESCIPCRRLVHSATRRRRVAPPLPVAPVAPRPVPLFAPLRGWIPLPAVGLAAAIVIAVGGGVFLRKAPDSASLPSLASPQTTLASIAVLPTETNLKFADVGAGVSESMAQRLSRIQSLQVIGPDTATAGALVAAKSDAVARQVGVNRIISTRLSEGDTGLVVAARMLDVPSGRDIWAKRYNTTTAQLSNFNITLAADISTLLRPQLSTLQLMAVRKVDTKSSQSYLNYLRGRAAWAKRDEQNFDEAIRWFQQALKDDPEFALAFAGLADTYFLQGAYNHRPRLDVYQKAERAAHRALELDPNLAESHTSLALVNLSQRNYSAAEDGLKEAIRLNPSYSYAHRPYANLLMAFERFSKARQHIDQTVALDPLSRSTRIWKALMLLVERKPDESAKELRALLDNQPPYLAKDALDWQVHLTLGQALEQEGQLPAAIEQLQKARGMTEDPLPLGALAHAYAKANRREEATAILNQIKTIPNHSETSLAFIYAALGDKDQAFQSLERAYERLDTDLLFLRIDPLFDDLRLDPRFNNLVVRLGLRQPST